MISVLIAAGVLALIAAGCGGGGDKEKPEIPEAPEKDAGQQPSADAGRAGDAGADGGVKPDGGVTSVDGGPIPDGGTAPDSGTAIDGGTATDAGADGGVGADGGAAPRGDYYTCTVEARDSVMEYGMYMNGYAAQNGQGFIINALFSGAPGTASELEHERQTEAASQWPGLNPSAIPDYARGLTGRYEVGVAPMNSSGPSTLTIRNFFANPAVSLAANASIFPLTRCVLNQNRNACDSPFEPQPISSDISNEMYLSNNSQVVADATCSRFGQTADGGVTDECVSFTGNNWRVNDGNNYLESAQSFLTDISIQCTKQ